MTLTEARKIAGSLGFPSKMPGTSYAIPAKACHVGSRLAKIAGTVCSGCYALAGRASYQQPNAAKGAQRRLDGIAHPGWTDAMAELLTRTHAKGRIKVDLGLVGVRRQAKGGSRYQWNEPGFHRWHDSGDLQSVEHLGKICEVAQRTPQIKHWLPTLEIMLVKLYRASGGVIPDNLTIRISSAMLDQPKLRGDFVISSVFSTDAPSNAYLCPARDQNHRCGDCRACWSPDIKHVAYPAH